MITSPDPMETLRTLCVRIDAWQQARGFSDSALFRTISGLNDKTHNKIRRGESVVPENHLLKYEAAWRECAAFDRRAEAELILMDLPPTAAVLGAIESVKLNSGIDRMVLVEAESGGGKTTALTAALSHFADSHLINAHEGWEASPTAAVGDLIRGCGIPLPEGGHMPGGFAARVDLLITGLQKRPRVILTDEGQHTAAVLNVYKHILNKTGCWVVLATMSSLWKKVQTNRWPEVKQLLHNRLHLRVPLAVPTADSVQQLLSSRLDLSAYTSPNADTKRWIDTFKSVATTARGNGLFAFCRKVANAARLYSHHANRGGRIEPEDLLSAVSSVAKNTAGFDAAAAP